MVYSCRPAVCLLELAVASFCNLVVCFACVGVVTKLIDERNSEFFLPEKNLRSVSAIFSEPRPATPGPRVAGHTRTFS
jgi:hypothetical protein